MGVFTGLMGSADSIRGETLALDSIEYLSDLRNAHAFNWNVRRLRHYKLFLLRN